MNLNLSLAGFYLVDILLFALFALLIRNLLLRRIGDRNYNSKKVNPR